MKLASSGSKEGIIQAISAFYAGSSVRLEENPDKTWTVFSGEKKMARTHVIVKRGRWLFEGK